MVDVEARLRAALGGYEGADWLDRACLTIENHIALQTKRKEWDCSTVGKRIRTARELAGMSQAQLAVRLGVEQWDVSAWEGGRSGLPVSKLRGISLSLRVSVAWLLMESEEGGPKVRNGVLRSNMPIKLVQYRRKKKEIAAARAEAARLNALRDKSVSRLTPAAKLRQDSRRKRKKQNSTQDPIEKKSEESGS